MTDSSVLQSKCSNVKNRVQYMSLYITALPSQGVKLGLAHIAHELTFIKFIQVTMEL